VMQNPITRLECVSQRDPRSGIQNGRRSDARAGAQCRRGEAALAHSGSNRTAG
jgi:hypothetical protein